MQQLNSDNAIREYRRNHKLKIKKDIQVKSSRERKCLDWSFKEIGPREGDEYRSQCESLNDRDHLGGMAGSLAF